MRYRITIDPIEVDTWEEAEEVLNLLDAMGDMKGNVTPIGDTPPHNAEPVEVPS